MPVDVPFPARLLAWRKKARVSQAALDAAIGHPRGYVAQIEMGRLRPPDRATCLEIGRVLGVSGPIVWDAARDERLKALDPDLYDHYTRLAPVPSKFSDGEIGFIWTLRQMDEAVARGEFPTLAEHLDDMTIGVLIDVERGWANVSDLGLETVQALRHLQGMSVPQRRAIVRVLVAACAVAERDETGTASPERSA